jgi:hypothetical protein
MSTRKSQRREDYEAYVRRSEELERRIAGGESIMDIMRADQLARGEARIREILAQDARDRAADDE